MQCGPVWIEDLLEGSLRCCPDVGILVFFFLTVSGHTPLDLYTTNRHTLESYDGSGFSLTRMYVLIGFL